MKMAFGLWAESAVEGFGIRVPPFPRSLKEGFWILEPPFPEGGPQERLVPRQESPKES